jgi:Translation initiation factor IF-2, N-terminal region/ATPase family associated with various cellular activities (AAA)
MPGNIRVYELARELGLTNKETLDLCEALGIGVKSHSSSIVDSQADRVRRKAEREGLVRDEQPPEPDRKPTGPLRRPTAGPTAVWTAPTGAEVAATLPFPGTPEERERVWSALQTLELTGTVRHVTAKGDTFLESDVAIWHPAFTEADREVYGGIPEHLPRPGDAIAFFLDPTWSPRSPGQHPAVRRGSLRQISASERDAAVDRASSRLLAEILEPPGSRLARLRDIEGELKRRTTELEEVRRAQDHQQEELTNRAAEQAAETAEGWKEIEAARAGLDDDRASFERLGGKRFMEALDPGRRPHPDRAPDLGDANPPPPSLVAQVGDALTSCGYRFDATTTRHALLANMLGFLLGHLTLYAGSPGAGKTTLAEAVASALGCSTSVVPVRPGWLDATDLLGFFDIREDRFVPAPFLELLLSAATSSSTTCVVFDEMNIARIENYGADLLSQFERSIDRPSGSVQLYATTIVEDAETTLAHALATKAPDDKTAALQDRVRRLHAIPPAVQLPPTLHLCGTLNEDHTTQELSPKVKDRALTVRVPPSYASPALATGSFPSTVWPLTAAWQYQFLSEAQENSDEATPLWNEALAALQPETTDLYHVSRRTAQTIRLIPQLSRALGLDQMSTLDDVLTLKVLQWVTFLRRDQRRLDSLGDLASRAESQGFPELARRTRALLEEHHDVVQYLK